MSRVISSALAIVVLATSCGRLWKWRCDNHVRV